jgi:hypothetical protein
MCDTRWRMMRVTGGGRAKETTHLTQRVRLMDANTLLLTFTWEDPTIYVEPYTYTYTFKRIRSLPRIRRRRRRSGSS